MEKIDAATTGKRTKAILRAIRAAGELIGLLRLLADLADLLTRF
ncbi:hypothetical protein [Corallococcus interemptor]|nr:hypothetical protein [Corallococcus interemptor]